MPSIPDFGQWLTPREQEVLNAFCSGTFTAKNVARKLGISHRTIELHMSNIVVKLGAENQLHAVLIHDRATRTAAAAACPDCDGTGDVHRADGEWLGTCKCPAGLKSELADGKRAPAQEIAKSIAIRPLLEVARGVNNHEGVRLACAKLADQIRAVPQEARYLCIKCGYSGPMQVSHQRPNGTGQCGYIAQRVREVVGDTHDD